MVLDSYKAAGAVSNGLAAARRPSPPAARRKPAAAAWAPGFITAAGVEVNPQLSALPVQLSSFLEMGYNWTGALKLTDENIAANGTNEPASMGELTFRGYYVQAGVGIKF
mgnify:CR=1 FL=1